MTVRVPSSRGHADDAELLGDAVGILLILFLVCALYQG
jgi:hypothetical protein